MRRARSWSRHALLKESSYGEAPRLVQPLSMGVANPDGFSNPWFRSDLDPLTVRAAQESACNPAGDQRVAKYLIAYMYHRNSPYLGKYTSPIDRIG